MLLELVLVLHFRQLGSDTGFVCPLVDGCFEDIDWVLDLLGFELGKALCLGEAVLVTWVVLPVLARSLLLWLELVDVIVRVVTLLLVQPTVEPSLTSSCLPLMYVR